MVKVLDFFLTVLVREMNEAIQDSDSLDNDQVIQSHRTVAGLLSLPVHLNEDSSCLIKQYPVRAILCDCLLLSPDL
jgi:hypothetical protein